MNLGCRALLLVLILSGVLWGQERGKRNQDVNPPAGHTGKWDAWFPNGRKKCESHYLDGKRDGKWIFWFESGVKVTEVNYVRGKRHGLSTNWHPNGKKAREATFRQDRMSQPWTYWNEKGRLRHGVERTLHKNGKVKREEHYSKGKRHGTRTRWHENGNKQSEENYKDSRPHGNSSRWFRNGQKQTVIGWKDGERHGRHCSWYMNGWKKSELRFHEGKLVERIPVPGSESPKEWGIQQAGEDIKAGMRRIFHYGDPWSAGKPLIDKKSGLPVEIVAGCCVVSDFDEKVKAYNETMRASARAQSPPKSAPDKK